MTMQKKNAKNNNRNPLKKAGSRNDKKQSPREKTGIAEIFDELDQFTGDGLPFSASPTIRPPVRPQLLSKNTKCFPSVYLSNSDDDGVTKSNQIR